ncbi:MULTISPECIES: MAPEG family protein [Okeania]|uniref:MAPEG family protein n=1 Tax=Okeania hirsuta TaxID=1458930 RepID=A0A3N6NT90_9CYAN|nr:MULTISPECIES: MAPEG family protein [Okeania]NEP08424.1 MAPEG family protein [Okeania sp. SIO4D6]NEP40792.1 MAPEG family protein [Okeania sp. SIO2H7]NET15929.1 MAPEG family protein [Okeania sp. SIO1H6]NEP70369.1 MAPEG family protein [Okeania sp. SIO2G5]NEP91602.1 MAPEG family protein [Okeania sp. SIO2F5]
MLKTQAILWPSLITVVSLFMYFIVTINVGRARAKYNIMPPQMTGEQNFERVLRVQQNTVEQIILFLPSLWLFSIFISPLWGAGIGTVWVVGRILFAWGYYQAAEKRTLGFGISSLAIITLLIGALVGILLPLWKIIS